MTHPIVWKRPPLIRNSILRYLLWLCVLVYLILAIGSVEVNWERLSEGIERGARFLMAFANPNFSSRWDDLVIGFQESLTMALTSTVFGVLLSIPLAIGAAKNLSTTPVYLFCRAVIAASRTLNEIIVAIFLVAMFGFGTFAGFLTLTFATLGFMAKLLAEDMEEISTVKMDALRSVGSTSTQRLVFGVLPQVLPRFMGLTLYRLDINFRESAVIGIVGAGGIGATLNTAMDRYEFDVAAAIILVIIAIVMAAEYFSGIIRRNLI